MGIRGLPANYGGFETCAEHITKLWAQKGHHVIVYCRKNLYTNRFENYNDCSLIYKGSINTNYFDTLSHTFLCILDVIFKKDIEYIHLYNRINSIYIPLIKLCGKKVAVSVDGAYWKRKKWGATTKLISKKIFGFILKYADWIVTDNQALYEHFHQLYGAKVSVIPYGAKIIQNNYKNELDVLEKYKLNKKNYFIFVGRLESDKGILELLQVYKKLNTNIPLIIIGDTVHQTEYKRKVMNLKNNMIKFLGFLYGKEYEILLKNALMYVSASFIEGTSPSLLAAMGAKVCVLVNGLEENFYTIGDAGFSYKENDLDDFYRVWSSILTNPEAIDEKAIQGFNRIKQYFTWENIANDYLELFKKSY
jgi:glycosyltransferase involved in cell wall biosynthesis